VATLGLLSLLNGHLYTMYALRGSKNTRPEARQKSTLGRTAALQAHNRAPSKMLSKYAVKTPSCSLLIVAFKFLCAWHSVS